VGARTTRHYGGVNRDAKVRAGDLLVATRALVDPNFSDSVVLVVDADGDGALGVVLNRPSAVPVAQVLDGWAEVVDEPETLFVGGPVSPEGALAVGLLSPDAEPPLGFREFAGRLGLVDLDTPIEILDGTLVGMRIFAGYSGWAAGQLEAEIEEGSWHVVPGEVPDVFRHDPSGLWRDVLRRQPGELAWTSTQPLDPDCN
jgi:putative transcriptional regulator